MAASQLPNDLQHSIERCAGALGDLARLKQEVRQLKQTDDPVAQFGAALFELELARSGDAETRANLTQLAELLLVFWRDGSGDSWSRLHPSLQTLWLSIAPMLVQFELRQFDQALTTCWQYRQEPALLAEAIEALGPDGHKRVEFARCLYHLELARHGVESSRGQFARRAGLLAEAYQDTDFADALIGHDAGLLHLWGELKPYLDEFFETLEEAAAKVKENTKKVMIPEAPPGREPLRPQVKTDPALRALVPDTLPEPPPSPPKPPLGSTREVPSFRTLLGKGKGPAPSAPRNITPPPGTWLADPELIIDEVEEAPPPPPLPPPPPPPDLTPPGAWKPPRTPSGEIELVDIEVDTPPPPPPVTPARGLAATLAAFEEVEVEFEPDEATLAFWDYTFASLQLAPAEGKRARMLATESRADRKRLTTWLGGVNQHLAVPEARAFASLVRLLLAGETKEKSLFGQPNPRRKEALEAAFGLLSPHPEAASHAAVWFELDGPETQVALGRGLELLTQFLTFCARNRLDPLNAETVTKYLAN